VAGGAWLLLAIGVLVGRLRPSQRMLAGSDPSYTPSDDPSRASVPWLGGEDATRSLLEQGARSPDRQVRISAITTLGRLGHRHEWAVDALIEALATGGEPVRVAAQLDRLAPVAGARLIPLLGHPSDLVRFCATRLVVRYPALARRHLPALTHDRSPNVRAAALETLRASGSGEALRCSLRLLDDPSARVRAGACRAATAIGGTRAAPFLVTRLRDESWWVREAARDALVALGPDVAPFVLPLLEADDPTLRQGAALVLQDIGALDDLLAEDPGHEEAERILGAGSRRLREAAADRARRGLRLGVGPAISSEPAP
jgi:HEAT repeat protein